jgi:hypothetical protein
MTKAKAYAAHGFDCGAKLRHLSMHSQHLVACTFGKRQNRLHLAFWQWIDLRLMGHLQTPL